MSSRCSTVVDLCHAKACGDALAASRDSWESTIRNSMEENFTDVTDELEPRMSRLLYGTTVAGYSSLISVMATSDGTVDYGGPSYDAASKYISLKSGDVIRDLFLGEAVEGVLECVSWKFEVDGVGVVSNVRVYITNLPALSALVSAAFDGIECGECGECGEGAGSVGQKRKRT